MIRTIWNKLKQLDDLMNRHSNMLYQTEIIMKRLHALAKAHPVVPGSPICGMRMPCGGQLRRAREGIEWLRAIGVSTVPRGPKGRRTATGMPTSGSRHPKTGNPAPFQIFARHPYMLINLGQRDEPSQRHAVHNRIGA